MATLRPFYAIRPTPAAAPLVSAVPYDVVDVDEARALAAGNPLSFLHVSRPEIDLPAGADAHSEQVYELASRHYGKLRADAPLIREQRPTVYVYRLRAGSHAQTGVAGCFSLDEYDRGVIKKHERTRRDKEDDRTRHMTALHAQTGPVFLTHKSSDRVDDVTARVSAGEPLFDFEAIDGVRHTIWRSNDADSARLVEAFAAVESLYIADGHHRAASAARARSAIASSEAALFLAVAFPESDVRILPYNRIVKDLNGMTPSGFLGELARRGFSIHEGPSTPEEKGEVSIYLDRHWYTLDLESAGPVSASVLESLDCNMLQEKILVPVLGIGDIRSDPRIDFVGGARGIGALEQAVNGGKAAVAFSMFPVSVHELMAVSDAGSMMPPKSTWFEPKLRDGLLIHEI